jgi:hypothetical protein
MPAARMDFDKFVMTLKGNAVQIDQPQGIYMDRNTEVCSSSLCEEMLTLCRSCLKPYCKGRKTAFFQQAFNLYTTAIAL